MTTIKDAPVVEQLIGTEKFPISNGSGKPVTATINQILEKVPEPDLSNYALRSEIEEVIETVNIYKTELESKIGDMSSIMNEINEDTELSEASLILDEING